MNMPELGQSSAADEDMPEPPPRPTIHVRSELHDMIERGLGLLQTTPELGLYTRGRMLVHVVRESAFGAWEAELSAPRSVIAPVSKDLLREYLDRAAHWVDSGRGGKERSVLPPDWVAIGIQSRGEWDIPRLEGIVDFPILRRDGTVEAEPGYDLATGLLLDPGSTEFPAIPERPTRDCAVAAWNELREPFQDFPFVAPSDESALLAAVLSLLGRQMIAGPCPMIAIGAPVPGAGKTLAADAVSILATGHAAPRMTVPRDDDEFRKRNLALAIAGTPLVLIDNVEGAFGSPSIAAQLTGESTADRRLGATEIVSVQFRPVWLVTGNNLEFKGDLGRRVIPCDLNPRVEHPEDRSEFHITDLLAYLRRHRPRLVAAALTILRAYHVAGRPAHGGNRKGSFEAWDDIVRGALIWVGAADPVQGQQRIRAVGDADLESLRVLFGAWEAAIGSRFVPVSTLLEARPDGDALRSALAGLVGVEPSQLNSTKVGRALRGVVGRVASGMWLERSEKLLHGAAQWRLARDAT